MAAVVAYERLFYAANEGVLDEVRAALSAGADPDLMMPAVVDGYDLAIERRPLWAAASYGHCEILSVLLEAGASVHGLSEIDHDGHTALHIAANCSKFNALKILVDAGADVNRGLTADVSALYARGLTALDILIHKDGHVLHYNRRLLSPIRTLVQAGAMPSPGFNWEYHRDLWLDANELEHKQAVNERWRAYFDKLARAGGYDAYARDERRKLVAIGDKFLGLDLAPQVIPIVVDFWGHPGDPWFSFSDLPDARGGAAFPGLRGGSADDDYDRDRGDDVDDDYYDYGRSRDLSPASNRADGYDSDAGLNNTWGEADDLDEDDDADADDDDDDAVSESVGDAAEPPRLVSRQKQPARQRTAVGVTEYGDDDEWDDDVRRKRRWDGSDADDSSGSLDERSASPRSDHRRRRHHDDRGRARRAGRCPSSSGA
mmetsp:Transcript_31383/g.94182  ORF Transcript_31383/g.94182 Transcript_31383/m.94182 type:complete len:430 (-) Transcript_31383:285-1574(-)